MASKKVADHTLYHLSPKGFWKNFRNAVVVNPEISSGLPIPTLNRYPQPGSRPEKYSTPATKASDPAENPYWKRDMRRAYPRLSVVTQEQLSGFLLQHAPQEAVTSPNSDFGEKPSVPVVQSGVPDLTEAIATITSSRTIYDESNLPPTLPTPHKRWEPQDAPDAPHDPHSYFPMSLVR